MPKLPRRKRHAQRSGNSSTRILMAMTSHAQLMEPGNGMPNEDMGLPALHKDAFWACMGHATRHVLSEVAASGIWLSLIYMGGLR